MGGGTSKNKSEDIEKKEIAVEPEMEATTEEDIIIIEAEIIDWPQAYEQVSSKSLFQYFHLYSATATLNFSMKSLMISMEK